jgi:5'(3')-deoxyribonucleotidase
MTHIAIDMDDVILDFSGLLLRVIKKEYGVDLSKEFEMRYWGLHDIIDPIVGESWWNWMRRRDWLWAKADAVDGSIGAIDTLRRQGHFLEIVTAKPSWAEPQVWQWLGKWRPAVHRVTIMPTPGKAVKADWTDASIIIDDKEENCQGFLNSGREAILFDRPHNRETWGIRRARGWQEVLNELR